MLLYASHNPQCMINKDFLYLIYPSVISFTNYTTFEDDIKYYGDYVAYILDGKIPYSVKNYIRLLNDEYDEIFKILRKYNINWDFL